MLDNFKGEDGKTPENLERGKFKVLFIEDQEFDIGTIKALFAGKNNIHIAFSTTGEEALGVLRKAKGTTEPFNLVVTDWRMKDKFSAVKIAEIIGKEELAGQTFMLTVFPEEELIAAHILDKLKGKRMDKLREKGVGEIMLKKDINKLPGLVYREMLRQRRLTVPSKVKSRIKSEEEIRSETAPKFDMHDLTPFEHVMVGGSEDIIVNGNKIFVNTEAFEDLQKDKTALRVILTPFNLTEGKKTLEDIQQARNHKEMSSGVFVLFELEPQNAYMEKGIYPTLKLGELDNKGQLKTFGVYFTQNSQKINLPEKAPEEITVMDEFKSLINYIGNENGTMWYKINADRVE